MKISQKIYLERAVFFQSDKGANRHEPGYHPHVITAL